MKNLLLSVLIFCVAMFSFSCNPDENPEQGLVGKWEIRKAVSTWDGTVTTSSDLSFSDSYEFKANGTFVKFNPHFGHELTGTYEEEDANDHYPIKHYLAPDVVKKLTLTFNQEILKEVLPTDESGKQSERHIDPYYWIIYGHEGIENLFLLSDGSLSNPGIAIADTPIYVYGKIANQLR